MLLWSGGDWGSEVSKALGTLHPDNCSAIHVNFVLCKPSFFSVFQLAQLANAAVPYLNWLPLTLSKDEIGYIQSANDFEKKGESGEKDAWLCGLRPRHVLLLSGAWP